MELVAYSGGANIAVLRLVEHADVINLRKIAGNLDYDFVNKDHKVDLLQDYSLVIKIPTD